MKVKILNKTKSSNSVVIIKDEIFDPFVSGKENGTGLGLALASKIISDHDGWISVDSVPGNTVFTISLAAINIKNNSFSGEVY